MLKRLVSNPWGAVVAGGVLAGAVDIGAACLIYRTSIPFILQSIAGGLLGRHTFEVGAPAAWLGLALQEAMGIVIAAIYVSVMRSPLGRLRRWPWWQSGTLFGVGVFVVMNYVVVPLSAWHRFPHFSGLLFVANLMAMLVFGLIVAFCGRGIVPDRSSSV